MTLDLPPTGFWSYTTSDDTASRGRLSQLRRLLADELQQKLGRRQRVLLWQDAHAIPHGAEWQARINEGIDGASFFIPIVTPAFLESEWCCYEVMRFRAREQVLGRNDLLFPLHYVDTDDLRPGDAHDPAVIDLLRARQMFDFRGMRLRNPESEEVALALDRFTTSIRGALRAGRTLVEPAAARPATATAAPTPAAHSTEAPLPAPGTVHRDGPGYPEMVLIPAGGFEMGIPAEESRREGASDDNARPVHDVTIARPFWLGRYPMTRGEYAAFVADSGYDEDRGVWRAPRGFQQTDRHPVVNVSWFDAEAYATWLSGKTGQGYRLPSESEWEYAARAGTRTARFWGDDWSGHERFAHRDGRGTAAVDEREPNPYGLHDVLGNVWEWCADPWHADYKSAPNDGSV